MAIRPPRRSALGVTWCEDFRRGRLGVRKNQGVIYQSAVRFVNIEGKWARFPADTAARIEYPTVRTTGVTAITFGCWIRDVQSAGWCTPMCQATAINAAREFHFLANPGTDTIRFAVGVSGTERYASDTITDWASKHMLVTTWQTGDSIRSYIDGQPGATAGPYAGSVTDSGWNLTFGGLVGGGGYTLDGQVADPFVLMGRAMSAAEIQDLYRRSTFH